MVATGEHEDDLRMRDRILAGDRSAAQALVDGNLDALYEFVHYRVGGDGALVEDLVQDTFLVGLSRLGSFGGESSLYTWLCGIAKNKIRAHRRKRQPRSLEELLGEEDAAIDAILAQVASEPLPDWVLERQETRDLVGATLSCLPPDHRAALVAKYVDGLSVAAIGEREGKSQKAAESLLTRARLGFARVFEHLARRRGGLE